MAGLTDKVGQLGQARQSPAPARVDLTNEHGAKRGRAQHLLDQFCTPDGPHGVEGELPDDSTAVPKKPKTDILAAVQSYYNGTEPLTDRQALVRLELSKLPLTDVSSFFGALRRVASTIEGPELKNN